MKALAKMAAGAGHMEWSDRPEPALGPDDVMLELIYGGLCHTDLGMINGDFGANSGYNPTFPLTMGHEFLGRVVAAGDNVHDVTIGQRMIAGSHVTCQQCTWCLRGRSMLCVNRRIVGLDIDGAWAERFVVPRIILVAVPDEVSDKLAALAEPFAVAAHAVDVAALSDDDSVAIVGPGTVGLLTLGALAGRDVTVFGRREDAEQLARAVSFGAVESVADDARKDALAGTFDVVFETSGSVPGVELAVGLLGPAGRLICVGLPPGPSAISTAQLVWQEKSIVGSRAYDLSTWRGIPARLAAAPQLEGIVSHTLALADFDRAIELVESRAATKVLLYP